MHSHNFAEIFFLDMGECLHAVNGREVILRQGDIVFMRPRDTHQILPHGTNGFVFTNVAFPELVRKDLIERYPAEMEPLYPAANPILPEIRSLKANYGMVSSEIAALSGVRHTRFLIERFLLNLTALLHPPQAAWTGSSAPAWLKTACLQLSEPEIFSGGVAAFVRTAGRSAEHVARTVRACTGRSPADLVASARMEYAVRELQLTDKSISEIGFECGYSKPSQFFKVFRRFHGTSPLRYRKQHRQVV